jgi:hypothetical protein
MNLSAGCMAGVKMVMVRRWYNWYIIMYEAP